MRATDLDSTASVKEICLACFDACGQCYAADVAGVREIVRSQQITPLPNAPALIEGVARLRGGLVPVLDLARVLGAETSEVTSRSRIVVLRCENMVLGLRVDAATDVLSIDPAQIEAVPELASQAGCDVVRGIVRREDAAPVMVLSLEAILEGVYRSAPRKLGES